MNWMDKINRKKLKDITGLYGLSQMVNGPTRLTQVSKTQIDLVFSNMPERISKSFFVILSQGFLITN